jgi:hypothetical protein
MIAKREGRSVSEVLREMIAIQLRERLYREMAEAARQMAEEYAPGGELTDLTALDSEDFYDA